MQAMQLPDNTLIARHEDVRIASGDSRLQRISPIRIQILNAGNKLQRMSRRTYRGYSASMPYKSHCQTSR